MRKYPFVFLFLIAHIHTSVFAQDTVSHTYLTLSAGMDYAALRDLGTSPLIYAGAMPYIALGVVHQKNKKAYADVQLNFATGNLKNYIGTEYSVTNNYTIGLNIRKLYEIKNKNSDSKWGFQLGGMIDLTNNVRVNDKLMNNSLGMDFVQTAFVSSKIGLDLTPKSPKIWNLGLFKIKQSTNPKSLDFSLNVPVYHSSYRNGYAYSNQSGVINKLSVFNGYTYRIWDGFRLITELGYTAHLKNHNAYRLAYVWDAYTVSSPQNRFYMGQHLLQFSLWYNLK